MHGKLTSLKFSVENVPKSEDHKMPSRARSFYTNSTSFDNFRDRFLTNEYKEPIGLVYKSSIDDLITNVFTVLRDLKIVWKPWNSSYIYKCQTGIPIENASKLNK